MSPPGRFGPGMYRGGVVMIIGASTLRRARGGSGGASDGRGRHACCKARKPTPLQGGKAALVCGGAFVERYRGGLGLRRPHCISY